MDTSKLDLGLRNSMAALCVTEASEIESPSVAYIVGRNDWQRGKVDALKPWGGELQQAYEAGVNDAAKGEGELIEVCNHTLRGIGERVAVIDTPSGYKTSLLPDASKQVHAHNRHSINAAGIYSFVGLGTIEEAVKHSNNVLVRLDRTASPANA